MNILLDENVPALVVGTLRVVLEPGGHTIKSVDSLGWKGKKDRFLLPDAADKGFDMFVTRDSAQLADPEETKAIKRSKMHWVTFKQAQGLVGMGLAVGVVVSGLPVVVDALEGHPQKLVRLRGLSPAGRWDLIGVSEVKYWH